MRHKKANKKLSKPTDQRIALLRSLSEQLILRNSIVTTDKRAAALKAFVDPIFTLAKKGDVHSIRLALKRLPNKEAIKKVFSMKNEMKQREGSFITATKLGFRKGDASPVTKVTVLF